MLICQNCRRIENCRPSNSDQPALVRSWDVLVPVWNSNLYHKGSSSFLKTLIYNMSFSPFHISFILKKVAFSSAPHSSRISGDNSSAISLTMTAILSLWNFSSVSACFSFNSGNSSFVLEYTSESEFLRILSPSPVLAASKIAIKKQKQSSYKYYFKLAKKHVPKAFLVAKWYRKCFWAPALCPISWTFPVTFFIIDL